MATFAWTIEKIYTKDITENGTTYTDVIKRVQGYLRGTTETSGSSVAHDHAFDMSLANPQDWSTFTTYGSVTEADVVSWVEARLGSDTIVSIKAMLTAEISNSEDLEGTEPKGTGTGEDFVATFPWS